MIMEVTATMWASGSGNEADNQWTWLKMQNKWMQWSWKLWQPCELTSLRTVIGYCFTSAFNDKERSWWKNAITYYWFLVSSFFQMIVTTSFIVQSKGPDGRLNDTNKRERIWIASLWNFPTSTGYCFTSPTRWRDEIRKYGHTQWFVTDLFFKKIDAFMESTFICNFNENESFL